jgi:hypothetical protein
MNVLGHRRRRAARQPAGQLEAQSEVKRTREEGERIGMMLGVTTWVSSSELTGCLTMLKEGIRIRKLVQSLRPGFAEY